MWKILLVAGGGACGALARYLIFSTPPHLIPLSFPWRTLIVNIVGSFVIGLMWFLVDQSVIPDAWSPFIFTGFLGAFTTFSTYSLDIMLLLQRGQTVQAAAHILASTLFGVAAVLGGFLLARTLFG